jgi:four helix bundle protein
LLNQLLRCGTSIGANIEEAEGAVSKKDFISKVSIAYKEARESQYWLRLLIDSGVIDRKSNDVLVDDCVELLKILNAIIKTSKTQEPVCSL